MRSAYTVIWGETCDSASSMVPVQSHRLNEPGTVVKGKVQWGVICLDRELHGLYESVH